MAKRNAEKELTDRNWDQEDDVEEVGTFSVASDEVLKSRAIKKAKRRGAGVEADSGSGAFRGFKGLLVPPGNGGEGLSNGGAAPGPARGGAAEKKVTFGLANGPAPDAKTNGASPQPSSSGRGASNYHRQLAGLNCSVRDWIVKHVDTNPLCDLTPIFRDYERYLSGIERLPGSSEGGQASDAGPPRDPPFVFQPDQGEGAPAAGPPANFSFSSGLFGPPSAKAPDRGADEDDSEEPPKAVVTEVKEEDAFYSKKCKLFYKKDNEFKEKGVGTLHLKPAANQKTQLLVRADTNLGNILLNVLVPPNMPCSRMGKNNVLIVCVPNPPINEKNATIPVTMLIRVKTTEDADELHKILLEKKEA